MKHEIITMTAEQLGIRQVELDGLVALERDLREGRIAHNTNHKNEPDHTNVSTFNMQNWHCGTAGCIGGWLTVRGVIQLRYDEGSSALQPLFYPPHDDVFCDATNDWNAITPEQAARAIRNFLATGEPRWREVVGLEPES